MVLASIATLIGFVIASGGIFVGADTAVSNEAGRLLTKYCQTGPRTVATFQGEVYLEHLGSGQPPLSTICSKKPVLNFRSLIAHDQSSARLRNLPRG
jgi:hypothetical protein